MAPIGNAQASGNALVTYGTVRPSPAAIAEAAGDRTNEPGDVSLDFVDTDLREIVAQVLGTILKVNYTIDPVIRGTATLRTVNPIQRSRVLPALQTVLAQNNATIFESGGLYRVAPAASAAAAPGAGAPGIAGSAVVPLRYASADDLAKVLQPYAGATGRVSPDPGRNALLIGGDPGTREALLNLVHAFDIDVLAGQSYALFPVTSGSAQRFRHRPQRRHAERAGALRWPASFESSRWSASTPSSSSPPSRATSTMPAVCTASSSARAAKPSAAGASSICRTARATTSPSCSNKPSLPIT